MKEGIEVIDKISIVVPIYNAEKYITRCIDSIIAQTYNNLEIILINGGSTDNSEKICDKYKEKDSRVIVINKENCDLAELISTGIEKAKGEYIGFVYSEDYIDIRMYEILYNNLTKNNADLSICNLYNFSKEEEVFQTMQKEKITVYNKNQMFEKIYDNTLVSTASWNKLYKKQILKDIKGFNKNLVSNSVAIHYIIDKCENIVITNLELYYYFNRQNSILNFQKYNVLNDLDFIYDRAIFFKNNNYINTYNTTIEQYINTLISLHIKFYDNNIKNNLSEKYKKNMKDLLKDYKYTCEKYKIKFNLSSISLNLFYYTRKYLKNLYMKFINIVNSISNLKMKIKFKKYCKSIKNKEKHIIFNAPNHVNIGDQAILIAEENLLKDNDKKSFSVLSHNTEYFLKNLSKYITQNDIIYMQGGGNFGTLWEHEQIRVNKIIKSFRNNKIIVFPQTIYYSNDIHGMYAKRRDYEIYKQCSNITIYCREKLTYDRCINDFKNIKFKLTSDIVTYLDNYIKFNSNRDNIILFCFRNDKEKINKEDTKKVYDIILNKYSNMKFKNISTVLEKIKFKYFYYSKKFGKKQFKKLLKTISRSKLLVTDRLHGMIFAAITNTPCIAFANSSGKVKGVYEWLSKENNYIFFFNNSDELREKIDNFINLDMEYKYNNTEMKSSLKKIICENENE